MKRVGNEWQWMQRHACGHTTYQAVFGGKRPAAVRKHLAEKVCPRCNLAELLRDNYGSRAQEDIEAIQSIETAEECLDQAAQ